MDQLWPSHAHQTASAGEEPPAGLVVPEIRWIVNRLSGLGHLAQLLGKDESLKLIEIAPMSCLLANPCLPAAPTWLWLLSNLLYSWSQ